MKKFISIAIALMLALSATLTALAATDDEISAQTEEQIKQAVYAQFYESDFPEMNYSEDIYTLYQSELSDGWICYGYFAMGVVHVDVLIEQTIGNYYFAYSSGTNTCLYKDGAVYEIKDAYESGVISDDILAKIAELNIGLSPIEDDTADAEATPDAAEPNTDGAADEEATPEAAENTTASDATSATEEAQINSATSDNAATSDSLNSNSAGGAVATGDNGVIIYAILFLLLSAGAVAVIRRKFN